MESTIPGACRPACLPAGLLEILKIKPAQPPSLGWGLGLSLAIQRKEHLIMLIKTKSNQTETELYKK